MRKTIVSLKAMVIDRKVTLSWYKSTPLFSQVSTNEFDLFRIYRKEEAFAFGEDYEEFFLNHDGADAQLIFEGSLTAINNRKYLFHDDSVETGRTYSYFIQTQTSCRIGPVPVRVRDPEVWWSYEYMMSRINNLCEQSGGIACHSICGRTVQGKGIPCLEIGDGAKTLGLVGLIHGGESGPELIIPAISRLLAESPQLFRQVRIAAIPAVNIDAREEMVKGTPWYLRTNFQHVDINRNFPVHWETIEYGYGLDSSDISSVTYRGAQPASAPETQAVMSVFNDNPPDAVFSFHWLAGICGLPALASKYAGGDTGYTGKCENLIMKFGKGLYPDLDFTAEWLSYTCSAGSLSAWLYDRFGIPAFDMEGYVNPDSHERECCRADQTDRKLITEYQERHTNALREVMTELANTSQES